MNYDDRRIEDAVLALLAAFCADDGQPWKGYDFGVMNRLHERGLIDNPVNRNKGVYLTQSGLHEGRKLAGQLFGHVPPVGR